MDLDREVVSRGGPSLVGGTVGADVRLQQPETIRPGDTADDLIAIDDALRSDALVRDLTRDDLRKLVQMGLERSNGNYRLLVQHFNMPPGDYKRFLSFLRKHNCHLPFQRFRVAPARVSGPSASASDAVGPVRAAAGGKL